MFSGAAANRRIVFLIAFGIYLLALIVRLNGIGSLEPYPDEEHWLNRSSLTLTRFLRGDYDVVTSHLGHPGIPAAVPMAVGQFLFGKWNSFMKIAPDNWLYVDELTASRLSVCVIACLVFPIIFLLGRRLFGATIAFVASLLFCFDPTHLSLSQVAHLDATLCLYVTLSVLLFVHSELRKSVPIKLLAGVAWGLALATKPTAVALLPAFGIIRLLFVVVNARQEKALRQLVTWSDLWTIICGHVVLLLFWTKLWDANHNFIRLHKVRLEIASQLEALGGYFQANVWLPALFLLAFGTGVYLLLRRADKQSVFAKNVAAFMSTASFLLLFITWTPLAAANITRYWGWVFKLRNVKHKAFADTELTPTFNYAEILFAKFPSLVIAGSSLGIMLLIYYVARRRRDLLHTVIPLVACIVCFLVWTFVLSRSPKQAARYILPTFPEVFVLASFGIVSAVEGVTKLLKWQQRSIVCAMLLVPLIYQAQSALSWAPYYDMYINRISGGFKYAADRGMAQAVVGYKTALRRIVETSRLEGRPQIVEVNGEPHLLSLAASRMYPGLNVRQLLEFRPVLFSPGADWLLSFSRYERLDPRSKPTEEFYEEDSFYELAGVREWTLYRVTDPDYRSGVTLDITRLYPPSARLSDRTPDGRLALMTRSRKKGPGYMYAGHVFRGGPGEFDFEFTVHLEKDVDHPINPLQPAIKVEVGRDCSKVVDEGALAQADTLVLLHCSFDGYTSAGMQIYWFGNQEIWLRQVRVKQLEDS